VNFNQISFFSSHMRVYIQFPYIQLHNLNVGSPSLYFLQCINVHLILRSPGLNTIFHIRSDVCAIE